MERKLFYRYLWSAILTSLSGTLCVQIDGIIVSHLLGAEAFGAIGALMPLMQIQLSLCLLIGIGGALQLAYHIGSRDKAAEQSVYWLTILFLLACSVFFVALAPLSGTVASWFCHSATLLPLATEYGRVLLLSAPVFLLLQGSGALTRAEGFPRRVLVAVVIANVLNLSLDVLFIAGFGTGIAGAGWATTLSNIVALAIILSSKRIPWKPLQQQWAHISPILLSGAPVALGAIAMFIRLSYLTGTTTRVLDAEGMIVLSMLLSVFLLVNLLAGGTTQALQPLAGQYIGQGDTAALYRTCRRSLRFTGLSSLIVTVLVIALAAPLCRLYGVTTDPTVPVQPVAALRIFAMCFLFYSAGYVLMVIHQIVGNRVKAMVIAVVQSLMVIPVFSFTLHLVPHAPHLIWWAFPIAECISLILIILLSRHELHSIYATCPRV